MLKRVARRVKVWVVSPSSLLALPPLPLHFRATKYLSSIHSPLSRRHFGEDQTKGGQAKSAEDQKVNTDGLAANQAPKGDLPKDGKTKGTEEKKGATDDLKKSETDKKNSETTTDPPKTDKTPIDDKNKEAKPADSKPISTVTTPTQTTNSEVKVGKFRTLMELIPWGRIAWGIGAAIGTFLFLLWQEELYMKYRIIWAAHDAQEIQGRLIDEWRGIKTDIPIKVDDEETPLPQWNWMWLLRNIPTALLSFNPLDQLSSLYESRLEQSKATITPIDFSPIIKKVLNFSSSQFIILDGQKGTGKSTAMMLLCWHEIYHGRTALFLHLSRDSAQRGMSFNYVTAIKKNPYLINSVADAFQRTRMPFTIVVDDMHKYLKAEETKDNAAIIIGYLWIVTEFYNVRIIFPTSDYGLKQAILDLPMHHSARFEEVRMYAPAEKELTEMINSGIRGKGYEKVEGNSPSDIARYCEVVGTLRELKLKYLRPNGDPLSSVRAVTTAVFEKNVGAIPDLLERVMLMQDEKIKSGKMGKDYIPYTRTGMTTVLETLCRQQYIDPDSRTERALCKALTKVNIARPICGGIDGSYEFHTFQMEVAVRALLNIPATLRPAVEHKKGEPESTGRGSLETIAVLKTEDRKFQMIHKMTATALGKK